METKGERSDFFQIEKKRVKYFIGGALVALGGLLLERFLVKGKPHLVSVTKEAYAFKEWLRGKGEEIKENIEDILAEAKYSYHEELEDTKEIIQKEREIFEKLENLVEKKGSGKKEG